MCQYLEAAILTDLLAGDTVAVTEQIAGMTPPERQAFRDALSHLVIALGHDCHACDGVVALREVISIGPIGGPYKYYHPACHAERNQPGSKAVTRIPVDVISFGYGHSEPPPAHLTVDLREHFRDPHVDPALRDLTAEDIRVGRAVMGTPGIPELIAAITAAVTAFRVGPTPGPVTVAVGCVGGRHRSAVVATIVSQRLKSEGMQVTLTHRDLHRPVIEHPA